MMKSSPYYTFKYRPTPSITPRACVVSAGGSVELSSWLSKRDDPGGRTAERLTLYSSARRGFGRGGRPLRAVAEPVVHGAPSNRRSNCRFI